MLRSLKRWQPRRGGGPADLPAASRVRTVSLAGVRTRLAGDPDDPYFRTLEDRAAELEGLAALIDRVVPRDATVVDVGANIGLSTILLARLAGRVVAFEPSPPNAAFLRENLALNGIGNVEVVEAAASDAPGALRFHVARFGAGSHVVSPGHVIEAAIPAVDVPAVPLDERELPPVAFLKIDAEGHEPNVLAGARALLARDRPLVYTEVNIWCLCAFAGHSPGAFVRALWDAFEVHRAGPDGGLVPLPDPYEFLHDTIVHARGIADVVLRPRPGAPMPDLPRLAWPEAARRAPGRDGTVG